MAGPFPQDFIESVRSGADLVQVVADYVPLKPAGARLKGLCPFHQEKTPSFSVDPKSQLFYCFGCQAGGDVFKFVMLYDGLGFGEAVEALARRAGIPMPSGRGSRPDDGTARLFELNRAAAAFFADRLKDDGPGVKGRAYLEQRGLSPATSDRLALGVAPPGWDALQTHLSSKRFRDEDVLKAGLVLERRSGTGTYDRFRDRLMFPIHDVQGRVIAFGGRALNPGDEPKYVNSPETPIYKKGEHLYGLDLARDSIRREGFAVVVEGYLDLAALVQADVTNVVASLGTAFTPEQARLLARYTRRVVFSYDGDGAGAKATARSLDLLLEKGFEVRVVDLPAGLDPDDYIREQGPEAYDALLRDAPDYLEFLIRKQVAEIDRGRVEDKVAAVNAVLPHIARLENRIARSDWSARLADALGIDDQLVLAELKTAAAQASSAIRRRAATSAAREPKPAEQRLVSLLLDSDAERERWIDKLDEFELEESSVYPIVKTIQRLTRDGSEINYPAVFEALDEGDARDLLTRIAFKEEPETGPTVEDCLWAFRRQRLAREGRSVRREIDALQRKDVSNEEVDRQLLRLQQLARERDAAMNCEGK